MGSEHEAQDGPGPASATAQEKNASRRSLIAQFSSVLALGISFLALAVGAYQTRLMQGQARASVWPHLAIGFNHIGDPDHAQFIWQVDNNGVGPALIKTVHVSLDDKPVRTWETIFTALGANEDLALVSTLNGEVLPPSLNRETAIHALKISRREDVEAFYTARSRFRMSVCYCSVYQDECWVAEWLQRAVERVDRCDADADDFQQ